MMSSRTARPSSSPATDRFGCRRHDLGAGVVRLALTGGLDAAAAEELDQLLLSVQADGAVAVLDLDDLTSVDSAGARTLCAGAARARRGGRRAVAVNARPEVGQALQRMGIARELKLVEAPAITQIPA